MVDPRMEELAAAQHGLITCRQAIALGFSRKAIRHQLAQNQWRAVARGVYRLAGAPSTARQRAMAAVLASGDKAVLSHTSAASLHALPGFELEPIVVSIPRARRSRPGVRIEQSGALFPHHIRVIDGIPCTSVARTLFDLCGDRRRVRPGRAARALDTALARRSVTMPALWRVLGDLAEHGREGTVWLRTLLTERGSCYVPPESELESRFLDLVHRYRLGRPARQVDVGDADAWIGRVDFLWRDERLIVEVDGAEHHGAFLDRRSDAERDERLTASGWTVRRFGWRAVVDTPDAVASTIRGALWPPEGRKQSPKQVDRRVPGSRT
jgi:very-short-patch-repair endonuclease